MRPSGPRRPRYFSAHAKTFGKDSPMQPLFAMGIPGTELIAVPFKIIQTPEVT